MSLSRFTSTLVAIERMTLSSQPPDPIREQWALRLNREPAANNLRLSTYIIRKTFGINSIKSGK